MKFLNDLTLSRVLRSAPTATGIACLLLVALAMPAMAGQGGRTLVSGTSVFSDCGDFALEMTGDLNGCLEIFPEDFTCEELEGFARYREWGEERFLDDDGVSSFRTKYTVEGVYSQGFCTTFDFLTQLAGGCTHKVFHGRGRFQGTNGVLTFNDVIPDPGVSGATSFLYHGDIKIRN